MAAGGKRVLFAEDDRFLRRAGEAALQRCGLTVIVATDGDEALALAQREHPDLVLLDMQMPKRSGIEVLRELRAQPDTRDLRVLILSGSTRESEVDEFSRLGVEGYWVKGQLSLKDFGGRVLAVLGRVR
jgi:two-component system, OmpR family, phosphate regulon response regulator PhoB